MSINDILKRHAEEGRLAIYRSEVPIDSMIRTLYLAPVVSSLLKDRENEPTSSGTMKGIMAHFVSGRVISVGHNAKCHMSLLKPLADGVWDFRVASPLPAIRIFGQFAAKDVFVALWWEERGSLQILREQGWKRGIRKSKAEWRKLFHPYPFLTGEDCHEYLTDAAF